MKIGKIPVLGASVALAMNLGVAQALEFSDTVFFGDSLTDSGAFKGNPDARGDGKFTTSPAKVWAEHLADFFSTEALANNPGNPGNTDAGGTNYSQGGAQITNPQGIGQTPSPQNATPIHDQVSYYLNGRDRVSRNALFSLWGGANDTFYNMGLVGAGLPPTHAALSMAVSAQQLVGEAERLAGAGARYILIPNLPDIGATPAMLLDAVQRAGAGNPAVGDALVAAATVLAMGGADTATVQARALAAAEAALGVPAGSLTPYFQQNVALGTGLSQAFNGVLLAAGNASKANIIALDIYTLFGEAMSDPGSFGLVNVTGTACTTPLSLQCTGDTLVDPRAPGLFLYADPVHPTAITHRILADYAISVVTAPALIANLPEVVLGQVRANQQSLQTQMDMGFGAGWSFFANGGMGGQDLEAGQAWNASTDDAGFMIGAAWRMDRNWVFGGALEAAYSQADFARNLGSFDANSALLSAFVDYRHDSYFASAIFSVGLNSSLDDVERVVSLGNAVRVERGSTDADVYALKALAGASLISQGDFEAGPFVSINYQSVDVDGYREKGQRSTAINFASQDRDSLLLEAGLFADYRLGSGNLHGAVSYEGELKDDGRSVTAGLNSLPGSSFKLYDIEGSSYFWTLNLGYSASVSDSVSLGINYALREGEGDSRDQAVNVGINVDF
ncbi:MAG TPA: autotransporter domain-containing protein [Thiolapillus brandeum]|uniref:Autotransporter domain-containing protein n=1 Tax=Thiolapillus brandeum TaxID=1076588 RepID=A0A831WFI8_9GAMM|nr:autotransporter domain-containing protein [Thiolapillus brandeum]